MRVAILTRDYPPAIGGIATHVEGLVKALRAKGVEADLYVGSSDLKTLLLPLDMPLKRYDLVHVQSAPYGAFVVGVPLVVTVHSPVLEEFDHYRPSLKLASIPAIALERASLSRAKTVLTVSTQSRAELLEYYGLSPNKVGVIGNGVDVARFSGGGTRDAGAMMRIAVVSRLEPRKNVAEAIMAVAELPRGSCQLEIAGDGSQRASLEELSSSLGLRESVHFLGKVSPDELPRVYARSGIFLTASSSEGFGLSLLEAMSSGCACVVSDLPTHRSLIQDGLGLVYNGRSDLVACLRDLLASPEKTRRLGEAARESALGHTWDRVAERTLQAYATVVADSSRRRSGRG